MVLTESSCCGCRLRTATLFYGYWVLVWSILMLLCIIAKTEVWQKCCFGIGGAFGAIASILLLAGTYLVNICDNVDFFVSFRVYSICNYEHPIYIFGNYAYIFLLCCIFVLCDGREWGRMICNMKSSNIFNRQMRTDSISA